MSILKDAKTSKITTHTFTPDALTKLIASDLGHPVDRVTVRYVVQDTSDDRFGHSPSFSLTKIEVTLVN